MLTNCSSNNPKVNISQIFEDRKKEQIIKDIRCLLSENISDQKWLGSYSKALKGG